MFTLNRRCRHWDLPTLRYFSHLFPTSLKCFVTHPPPFWFQNISADVWCLVPFFAGICWTPMPIGSSFYLVPICLHVRTPEFRQRLRSSKFCACVVTWPQMVSKFFPPTHNHTVSRSNILRYWLPYSSPQDLVSSLIANMDLVSTSEQFPRSLPY